MMVKICGITRREDAVAAVEAGAQALGFNFYKHSPRFIEPEYAAELGEDLPVLRVGVFVDEYPESVMDIAERAALLLEVRDEPLDARAQCGRRLRR